MPDRKDLLTSAIAIGFVVFMLYLPIRQANANDARRVETSNKSQYDVKKEFDKPGINMQVYTVTDKKSGKKFVISACSGRLLLLQTEELLPEIPKN